MSDYGAPRDHVKVFGIGLAWLLALIVAVGAISIGLWAFGVFTADIKGAGNAIKVKNAAVNRIQKQEMFEQLNADIDGYVAKIAVAKQAVAVSSASEKALRETELVGVRQVCIDAVQQYNAESRKYTSRDFKSVGLPPSREAGECS